MHSTHDVTGWHASSEAFEAARLVALRNLELLDTDPETVFDEVVRVAALACAAPMAAVTLVDEMRQWFKARIGIADSETERSRSVCSVAIAQPNAIFEVSDLRTDPRFARNPSVCGAPFMRSYAGVPLVIDGFPVGTLCVIETKPRRLTEEQRAILLQLARSVVSTIEYRRATKALVRAERGRDRAESERDVFAAAITHAHDGVLVLGSCEGPVANASIVYANAACGLLIERDAASLIGRSVGDAVSDPVTLAAIESVCAAARSGTFAPFSFALRRSDGSELHAEAAVAATPDRVEDVAFVVILRDGTDRHVAEQAMLAMHAAVAEHETVKRSEERLRALFARTPAITYTIDREMTITSSLGGGLRAIGLEPDQAVGWPLSTIFSDETSSRPLALHKRALRGESVNYERFHHGRKLSVFLEPIWTRERSVEGVSGIVFDLTEYAATEYLLEQTEALTARSERAARTGSWTHDIVRDRIVYSEQSLRIFGVTDRADARESFYACVVPEDRERVRAQRAQAYNSTVETTFEYQIDVGGTIKFINESVEITRDAKGVALRAAGVVVDITDRRHAELESFRRTETDAVTGLPNRAALFALVRRRLAAGKRYGAVLAVNIDRFRSTNDGFGRDFGDRVLIAVAERLVDELPAAYVARLENATFAVLLEGVDPKDTGGVAPKDVAARLHEAFRVPFELEGHRLATTISIGIAAVAGDEAAESMTRKADVALQAAKRSGGDRTVTFDDDLARMSSRRVALELDLRSAIERKELSLEYQPIVDEREEIVAVEALLRWHHPAFGRVPPDEFIPIAEANGTIVPIGRWVVRTACADLAEIRTACGRAIRVAVNVSAKQFSDAHLQTVIGDALATAGLEPAALEIEITESTLANNPAQASRILAQLRTAGTTVSIDDFGTGYSSLSSLRRLPIDSVKIDRSFVATTPADAEACAIVEAILGLARQLSLGVVAEGVETAEQSRYLHELGTHRLQGYFFSRPAPATTIIELVCEAAREKTLRPKRLPLRARRAETA